MFEKLKRLFVADKQPPVEEGINELPAWAVIPDPDVTISAPLLTPAPPKKPRAPRKPRQKKVVEEIVMPPLPKENPEKLAATAAGEPWVAVLGMDVDLDNLSTGAFNIDWNDIFIARLVKAGYKGKNDVDIVDQWFQTICRNVVLETYEQEQADPDNRRKKKTK